MKKQLLLLVLSGMVFCWGCSTTDHDLELLQNDLATTAAMPGPMNGDRQPVLLNSSGQYYCNYLGGTLNFGGSFVHPTTASAFGTPYIVDLIAPISAPNLLEVDFQLNGYDFSLIYGSFVSPLPANAHTAVKKYQGAIEDYYTGKIDTLTGQKVQPFPPNFEPVAAPYGLTGGQVFIAANGVLTITGRFVHDPDSPTNISIIGIPAPGSGGDPPIFDY